jgi:hypothetical protein
MEDVGIFYGHFILFIAIGIFCGNLVYFSRFGMLFQEKSGNPAFYEILQTRNKFYELLPTIKNTYK